MLYTFARFLFFALLSFSFYFQQVRAWFYFSFSFLELNLKLNACVFFCWETPPLINLFYHLCWLKLWFLCNGYASYILWSMLTYPVRCGMIYYRIVFWFLLAYQVWFLGNECWSRFLSIPSAYQVTRCMFRMAAFVLDE